MRRFIVRPYLGHDCDSVSGFNNGYYLDEIEVEATDESQAIELAMEQFETENDFVSNWDKDGHFGEGTFYSESSHTDANGDDIDQDETYEETFYTYQYVCFANISEVQIEATV